MKKHIAFSVLCAFLVLGAPSAAAFAQPVALGVATESDSVAAFTDLKLYVAVKEQLSAQGVAFTPDDSAHTLTLTQAELAKVTELTLINHDITNTTGLGSFTSLTSLNLAHNSIGDVLGLAGLTGLKVLNLYDNYVHNFAPLEGLAALEELNLGENNEIGKQEADLSGLNAIGKLTSLKRLDFSENYAPSIVGHLTNLHDLQWLNLMYNNLSDVSGLSGLTSLTTLILSHNSLSDISPLFRLSNLTDLRLNANNLNYTKASIGSNEERYFNSFKGVFTESGDFVWPQLTVLDIADNTGWGMRVFEETGRIFQRFMQDGRELGFAYDRIYQYAGYPYTEAALADKVAAQGFISYDDFGAYRDGVRDDYNAMRNAHRYANAHGCEVRAAANETNARARAYHIFRLYDATYNEAYTSVDWQGATFVVHDELVDFCATRFAPLLVLRPGSFRSVTSGATRSLVPTYKDIVTLNNPGWTGIGTTTTNLSTQLASTLSELNAKGYSRYYVMLYNSATKHYIRFGSNANSGSSQWDGFIIDKDGKLEDGQCVQWDFSGVNQAVITPIPAAQSHVRNATFVCNPVQSKTEVPRSRSNKEGYYLRNLQIRDCANVEVAGIAQTVGTAETNYDNDELSGSYYGFFNIRNCADVTMRNCSAWARKYEVEGRSTYGIVANYVVNISHNNVNNSNSWEQQLDGRRWGLTGNNHCKNISFTNCTLNRIDAHEGYYNMTATGCKLGSWGFRLIGKGPLTISNCEVHSSSFIMLRYDYGSTWDGACTITNCRHYTRDGGSQGLFNISPQFESDNSVHDFGYPLRFPELTVNGLTVDYSEMAPGGKDEYYIVPNHEYNHAFDWLPADYWPGTVQVSGVDFINYDKDAGHAPGYEPHFCLVSTEKGTVASKLGSYSSANVTYNGSESHADVNAGTALEVKYTDGSTQTLTDDAPLAITSKDAKNNYATVTLADFTDKELAIAYTGDLPCIALVDASWKGWTAIRPYYVERGTSSNVAYFSTAEIQQKWQAAQGSTWTGTDKDNKPVSGTVGDLARLRVTSTGSTSVNKVVLGARSVHEHSWPESWTVVKVATCTEAGLKQRACTSNAAHVQTQEIEALGHDWATEFTVDVQPTASTPGSKSRHCTRCDAKTDVTEIPATGGGEMRPPSYWPVNPVPGKPASPTEPSTPNSPNVPSTSDSPSTPPVSDDPDTPAPSDEGGDSADPSTPGTPGQSEGPSVMKGWVFDGGSWRYALEGVGSHQTYATGWLWEGTGWYYFNSDGTLRSGWLWDKAWYHLNTAHNGFFGAMEDGWIWEAGEWYYLNPDANCGLRGHMCTGWTFDGLAWYYLQPNGAMLRNSPTPDGNYVGPDGRWYVGPAQ